MSDQDFFFDEEDEKPARAAKAAPRPSSKTAGSKSPARTTPAKSGTKATAPEPESQDFFSEQMTVGKAMAMLVVVCALLLGVVIGVLVGQSRAQVPSAEAPVAAPATGQTAPQLTPDQLNSGQLPPGHPSLGATGSTAATGSTNATGK